MPVLLSHSLVMFANQPIKPGQHVLINKGQLHAFRKMTFDELPNTDCHAAQRSELVAMLKEKEIDRAPTTGE